MTLQVDPQVKDQLPLHRAAFNGHLEVVQFFIEEMKCDPTAMNNLGETMLHLASQSGHVDIVKYLVDTHHCDPLCQDFNKSTPLHHAAANPHLDVIKFFIEDVKCLDTLVFSEFAALLQSIVLSGHIDILRYYIQEDNITLNNAIASMFFLSYITAQQRRDLPQNSVVNPQALSPSITVFVLGNSGSGKSTLVKSLSQEGSFWGWLVQVKGVLPHTAGIVPTTLHSRTFGEVNIYDFAGHEHYYASHEMILDQVAETIVLLTVDVSLSLHEVKKQLQYWLFILSSSSGNKVKSMHVIIIGSHTDQLTHPQKLEILQYLKSIRINHTLINYEAFVCCDCRYPTSNALIQLHRQLAKLNISVGMDSHSTWLCVSIINYLNDKLKKTTEHVTISLHSLSDRMKHWRFPAPKLADPKLLYETFSILSANFGHFFFLPCDSDFEESILILDEKVLLSQVHGCLDQIKNHITSDVGIIEEKKLREVVSTHLKEVMNPKLAISYLVTTQFCTKITEDQLIVSTSPDFIEKKVYYFFPNLVLASKPAELWLKGEHEYMYMYSWCLKCADGQFFTPRYLHTLFIQLVKFGREKKYTKHTIWKNGILLVHGNGVRFIVEGTNMTTQLKLVIQCVKGFEFQLVQQRSSLISLINILRKKVCPQISTYEFLLHTQSTEITFELPMVDIAKYILGSQPFLVSHEHGIPQHIKLSDLLFFESFHQIPEPLVKTIFANKDSEDSVPDRMLNEVCEAVYENPTLLKSLRDKTKKSRLTFSCLYSELHKYTIFPDGNLCVRFK